MSRDPRLADRSRAYCAAESSGPRSPRPSAGRTPRMWPEAAASQPVLVAAIIGVLVGPLASLVVVWQAACLVGWDAAVVVFLIWIWSAVRTLDATGTEALAVKEDPSTGVTDIVIIGAGVASLAAVGLVLVKAGRSHGDEKALLIAIGLVSVALSWAAVHTVFMTRYARMYYGAEPGGIDFNEASPPDFLDFAYVSFTIGLTFQVSDTNLTSKAIRRAALGHALLSFLFGAIIIGLTINVLASLLG